MSCYKVGVKISSEDDTCMSVPVLCTYHRGNAIRRIQNKACSFLNSQWKVAHPDQTR